MKTQLLFPFGFAVLAVTGLFACQTPSPANESGQKEEVVYGPYEKEGRPGLPPYQSKTNTILLLQKDHLHHSIQLLILYFQELELPAHDLQKPDLPQYS